MSWETLRGWLGAAGVTFLIAQLVKLFGLLAELLGPIEYVMAMFADVFPWLADWLNITFGWSLNGMDIMAASVALSASFIIISAISTSAPMKTIYVFRFFLIPYAFIVIGLAIFIQVITPFFELGAFHNDCRTAGQGEIYGSTCQESARQLRFLDTFFGTEEDANLTQAESDAGIGLILSLLWIALALPVIAVIVFFFKRLRVNKLLKRVAIAVASSAAIIIASAAWQIYTTDMTVEDALYEMFAGEA